MSLTSSDYLKRLASAYHLDYINSYSQFQEQVTLLTNDGAHYTRAPLAARGSTTCSCVQTYQIINIWVSQKAVSMESDVTPETQQPNITDEDIKFWLVSPLESIVQDKCHCGIFIEILVSEISVAASYNYLIPYDIIYIVEQWI
ncbi:MAG: hypothetical protein EZS28_009817 [Streblomastix strix]|uniref:Uncharacterized protein n=1 Tax=Streblomastix strix TaxID=222440 RepID=A0A5J4WIV7_9EUKA|nr:MAG: hypothetical protein EZS28_009817 [Streblomastix strix]